MQPRGRDGLQSDAAAQCRPEVKGRITLLRGLERRGIVSRARGVKDSRSVAIALTEEGLELARVSAKRARALNREFFAGTEAKRLFGTLTGLAAGSERRREIS